jgi:hypothetical protein
MRVEHDYRRGGALAYLAAWDVHRGQVIGRCEHTTGIRPFSRLVAQVMSERRTAGLVRTRMRSQCPKGRTERRPCHLK